VPGLVGFISDSVSDEQLLDRMVNTIKHEPWHRVDRYVNPPFHVARVHLGVFNPEPQPIFNEDGTLCMFMYGKVYGNDDGRKRLEARHRFVSDSDAEYCLHLYEEHGAESLKTLNGSFVLLLCDLREKKAVLANDRNGLRALYYAEHNGALLFAPQMKAILEDGTFKRQVDLEALAGNLSYGEFWGDRTVLERIQILPPASMLTRNRGQLTRARYWDFHYQPDYALSEGAIVEQLVEAFRKAVAVRLQDSLRYGVSLSGGLDSRSVLAAVDPEKRKGLTTFTYGPLHCGEVKIAEKVASKCGTSHRSIEITPRLIIQNAQQAVWLSEGRMSIWLSYMYPVYKSIRDDVDAVFDGYELDPFLGGTFLRENRIRGQSREELYRDYQQDRTVFREAELLRLFAPRYRNVAREAPASVFGAQYAGISGVDPRTSFDEFFWRTRAAYLTASHGWALEFVEMLCPTVDNDLITVIFKIPPDKRMKHHIYRLFLKQLSPELARIPYNKTMVPASWPLLLWRAGKVSRFGRESLKQRLYTLSRGRIYIPNSYRYIDDVGWLRVSPDWKKYVRDMLLDPASASREYFEADYVSSLIRQHEDGTRNHADKIMRLLTFEQFLRLFLA
jgi:asparagine synthase (glutamine-hydrolysing)